MQSTTIIAFDQHAATTVAAVLLPGQRTPALHSLTSDSPTIVRFVKRVARENGAGRTVDEAVARLRAIEEDLRGLMALEPLQPRVARLRCFRGIDDLTALTIAAELGDVRPPKRAMPICGASSSKPRGTTGIIPASAGR